MNVYFRLALLRFCAGCFTAALAQDASVNPQNRTVSVSSTETVQVDPEVAVVSLGSMNYGPTRDGAYARNTDTAKKIIATLTAAGVRVNDIETLTNTLARIDASGRDSINEEKKERQHQVDQD